MFVYSLTIEHSNSRFHLVDIKEAEYSFKFSSHVHRLHFSLWPGVVV